MNIILLNKMTHDYIHYIALFINLTVLSIIIYIVTTQQHIDEKSIKKDLKFIIDQMFDLMGNNVCLNCTYTGF